MKMNLFIINGKEETNDCGLHEFRGHRAVDIYDPEAELVDEIDDEKKSSDQILAQKFLKFLGEQRITLNELIKLPIIEQKRLKREFLEKLG